MNQRIIKLGDGLADFFELIELATANHYRVHAFIKLETPNGQLSLAVAFKPASKTSFMPIYVCLQGFKPDSKRVSLFEAHATAQQQPLHELVVKDCSLFYSEALYYQYLIGLLRLQRILPPMS